MGDRDHGEARYRAFLSYSHKDAAPAARLHRRLEAYRIPRRLVGRETARGAVPARLSPIFRDREELPAATDLSETVREALTQSGALVILCSPHAAGSLWVAEEIRVFRELHPGRPILAAILEGDPPACFPPLLRAMGDGHEPLATDLRRERDGQRLGLLKLVAGITGLGLDDLVQRDATRRVRRVTAVTAGAMAAVLVMAVLVVVAIGARREAERQEAEAEGLIEFMLTDLRRDLRGVGRLDIMSTVNERALSYYVGQEARGGRSNPAVRARIDHTMGEDLLTRGDEAGALRLFRQAYAITTRLIAQSPRDPNVVFVHAQSEYWIGRVYELRQDWQATLRQYSRFEALTGTLIAIAPNNPDYMMQVGWAAIDLGNVQLSGIRDAAVAQRSYEKAVLWFGRAVQARPTDVSAQLAQANAYAWLADSFFNRAMWRQSLAARLRQFDLVEQVHRADPANLEYSFRLAAAQRAVSRSYFKTGDHIRARLHLFRAYDWSRDLMARDPRNSEWLLFGALVSCDLYFTGIGTPAGATLETLRQDIRAAARTLSAQNNPRRAEISRCADTVH